MAAMIMKFKNTDDKSICTSSWYRALKNKKAIRKQGGGDVYFGFPAVFSQYTFSYELLKPPVCMDFKIFLIQNKPNL